MNPDPEKFTGSAIVWVVVFLALVAAGIMMLIYWQAFA